MNLVVLVNAIFIIISRLGYHNVDPFPFDGPGGIVSHIFNNQRIHFDDDEDYKYNFDTASGMFKQPNGKPDFLRYMIYYTGKIMYLFDSTTPGSVMNPNYKSTTGDYGKHYKLHAEDIMYAQRYFGK